MRLSVITLILTFFASSVFAQWGDNYIQLSNKIITETKNISGFDKIDVSEDFEVHIRFSDTAEKVKIEANENLHDLIKVERQGTTLKIYTESYSTSNGIGRKRSAREKLVAYITAKNLSEIKGDEDVLIILEDKLYANKLTINLDEDCTLEGHLVVKDLVVQLNEDSVLDIEGSAQTMHVEANEDSIIEGYDFEVDDLVIKLKEDSKAKLTVNGDIDLRAREDSYFCYRGDGHFVRKRLTGDSEVKNW